MRRPKLLLCIGLLCAAAMLPWGAGVAEAVPGPGETPDYFGTTPNWAYSPLLTKFKDTLPGLWNPADGPAPAKSIPLAVPDKLTYPGSDYYEIEVQEFSEVMHSEMGGTRLRGYVQVNNGTNAGGTANDVAPAAIRYLGPVIVAAKDRPVRIKFTNKLPAGAAGKLFLPVDTTIMGSGPGPDAARTQPDEVICASKPNEPTPSLCYTENRAVLHLHGGRTPWISDGTPHQWITPALDSTTLKTGASVVNVPDMWFDSGNNYAAIPACAGLLSCSAPGATNDPGPGAQTYYYTNQQSARFLFYHDHAWGITRLNVYAGMAAGYLIADAKEEALINAGTIPGSAMPAIYRYGIPLVIQDKTFVDAATILGPTGTDPTWNWGTGPRNATTGQITAAVTGDLWWPHVYMPAQNPYNPDFSGVNPMGRWVYGPWFWPPTPVCGSAPDAIKPFCIEYGVVPNPLYGTDPAQPPEMPGTPNPSWGAEAFLDTPVVNGVAYPTITVQPQQYRFRILNAAHDRFFNLQLYRAVNKAGYTNPTVAPYNFTGTPADLTEVAMVPAAPTAGFPAMWPIDGREGGAPDPATRGPAIIQIGNEGGFLPKPLLLPNQPVNWNVDPTLFTAGLVLQQNEGGGTLFLGPAERADIIVDFSKFAGHTLILYNDAPAPWPALDPHYDYYTGAPDRRAEMGGADTTLPGQGPNTRTLMQIVVAAGGDSSAPVDDYNATTLTNLQTAFAGPAGVFATGQDTIVVGQQAYDSAYGATFPATWPEWGISRISDNSIQFRTVSGELKTVGMEPKAIQDEMGEVFDDYGRMSAKLGLEVPFTNAGNNNFNLQNFVDPSTEIVHPGEIQIWKITHNGVDTHPIHFHLFDVQVLNRVGWDGFIYLPDDNELGWKETVRISPLEDTIVALRPILPQVPFPLPHSVRPLNPAMPIGSTLGFSQIDPETGADLIPLRTNVMANFGHEYVWHCHILSHEENDMMRPMVLNADSLIYTVNAGDGVWQWSLGNWSQLTTNVPQTITPQGKVLYGTFAGTGVWKLEGGNWTQVSSNNPEGMAATDSALYGDFGTGGVWKWDSLTWSQVTPNNPEAMAASGSVLYGDFGTGGIWKYDGAAWSFVTASNPEAMAASGTMLYGDFGTGGIWAWDGTTWTQATANNAVRMTAAGRLLYAVFGADGVWKWDGTAWTNINPNSAEIMAAAGLIFYGDFGTAGIWRYDGTNWSQLTATDPAMMASAF
ncbi:MAG: multicopper oxidase domain-containing protein [Syntrophales bacterium]|nr:multicopper oxidase domain-containing protein [Syntrophales bacterium]